MNKRLLQKYVDEYLKDGLKHGGMDINAVAKRIMENRPIVIGLSRHKEEKLLAHSIVFDAFSSVRKYGGNVGDATAIVNAALQMYI